MKLLSGLSTVNEGTFSLEVTLKTLVFQTLNGFIEPWKHTSLDFPASN